MKWAMVDGKWNMEEADGSEKIWEADLVMLSMGFLGPEQTISEVAGIDLSDRGNIAAEYGEFETSMVGVFAAGDCRRGQSLVVWAINEGRAVAEACDKFLSRGL